MSTLAVTGVTKRFGGVVAVDRVDLQAQPGHLTGLIGPNGAGKTTLFDCVTGARRADAGSVRLGERDLTHDAPEDRARAGVARTFQKLQVFDGMTVHDNLVVAAEARHRPGWRDVLRPRRRPDDRTVELVERVLAWTGTATVAHRVAGELPVGTLRLVELGRALCTEPQVLLLDEPASGLDTAERPALQELLLTLPERGLAILLVEHDLDLVLDVCDAVHVMDRGRIIASGAPRDVRDDPAVQQAYLGGAA